MTGFPTVNVPEMGGIKDSTIDLRGLSAEQKTVAEGMINDAQRRDVYNALATLTKAVNQTGSIIGGIDSDDLEINHNPLSGRSVITVSKKFVASLKETPEPSDGLPDPTGYAAEKGLYIREVTLSGDAWVDAKGGTVVKVGSTESSPVKAWVIDHMRLVEATVP